MKYKKRIEALAKRIRFWEQQGSAYQKANKKPGGI